MANYDPKPKVIEIEKLNPAKKKKKEMFEMIRILDLILPFFFYHFICKSFEEKDFIELHN